VDVADDNEATALMHAAAQGHTDVVKALLEAGADPEATDVMGKNAEGYATSKGHDATAEVLKAALPSQ
jgi:ankyrin repeat protein